MSKEVRRVVRQFMLVVLLAFWSAHAFAQSFSESPDGELKKKIKVSEEIQPLGESPFGESISLYSGSLSFNQVDVSLPGQGPLLQLCGRRVGSGKQQG
jgi:hypothetical protein